MPSVTQGCCATSTTLGRDRQSTSSMALMREVAAGDTDGGTSKAATMTCLYKVAMSSEGKGRWPTMVSKSDTPRDQTSAATE